MGSANLTNEEIAMRYPPSILDWELKHGIVRYERNGVLYVSCARPFNEVCASIEKENEQRNAQERMRKQGGMQ